MKIVLKVILFLSFINNLYAESKFLYPVYSVKLDKISLETIKMLIVDKQQYVSRGYVKPEDFYKIPAEYEYMLNLNNLLLLQKKTDKEYLYNLLGRISIDEDNKLKYEPLENNETNSNYEMIEKKQSELKKNIEYLNENKLSLETIKIILDVDLIDEDLGKKLYSNKENILSVEKATKNLINCRFWEQMVNIYSREDGCKYYSLCDSSDYRNKWDYTVIYAVVIDDVYFRLNMSRDILKFFENFDEKSNIYNKLNSKYISQTFEEWCVAQRDQSIPPEKECQPTDIKYFKKIK